MGKPLSREVSADPAQPEHPAQPARHASAHRRADLEKLAAEISQSFDIEISAGFLYVFGTRSDQRLCIWIHDYQGRSAFWWRHMGQLGPICPDDDAGWATAVIRAYLDTLDADAMAMAGTAA